MLAPIAPAPATRITAASSSSSSAAVSVRSGARTSGRIGTPRRAATTFAAAWNGKRSSAARSRSASSERSSVRLADERRHDLRDRPTRGPDTAPGRAVREPARDERLRADEDVEPVEQVRLDRLPRLVGHLEPAQVRRASRAAAR